MDRRRDPRPEERDLVGACRRLRRTPAAHGRSETRWQPTVVARRALARIHIGARRGPGAALRASGRRPGGVAAVDPAHRGGRGPDLVSRRVAARLHRTRARPERRRDRCREASRRAGSPVCSTASTTMGGPKAGRITCTSSPSTDPSPCSSPTATTKTSGRHGRPTGGRSRSRRRGIRTGTSAPRTTSSRCRPTEESHVGSPPPTAGASRRCGRPTARASRTCSSRASSTSRGTGGSRWSTSRPARDRS